MTDVSEYIGITARAVAEKPFRGSNVQSLSNTQQQHGIQREFMANRLGLGSSLDRCTHSEIQGNCGSWVARRNALHMINSQRTNVGDLWCAALSP